MDKKSAFEKTKVMEALNIFYYILQNEADILSKKDSTIKINKLHLRHILKIQSYIESLTDIKGSAKNTFLQYLNDFCELLTKKNIAKIYYKAPHKKSAIQKKENRLTISLKFQDFMTRKNYSDSTCQNYVRYVEMFLRNANYKDDFHYKTEDWVSSFKKFEEKVCKRVLTESITPGTGYEYLKAISLFSKFLNEEQFVSYKYRVPQRLICNGNRSNEYVNDKDIFLVIEKIFEASAHVLRDISILMILIETGCRPVEVENLNIDDINTIENLIVLKSKKSSQRTLELSKTSIKIIKSYLLIRKNYFPKENTESLFLTTIGTNMLSKDITQMIKSYNMKTFKKNKFTAKTLRHRFITNALNAGNKNEKVMESVGHKHLISTHYYFYRDIDKMKKTFMEKSFFRSDSHD
ncbi:site-specific integrase [Cytobacillus pseudoceanisediminis]|uniref:Site-specific integrase n=1 Tax=Cytobacillus pseudoceanisediminis TaxID=3051614 RepID=A0ABZ2ZLR9_9BACI